MNAAIPIHIRGLNHIKIWFSVIRINNRSLVMMVKLKNNLQ